MGSRYSQLSLSERHQIARWRDAKVPVLDMARRLSRHVSTVHRELRRNRTDAGAWLRGYFAIGAQQVSDLRRTPPAEAAFRPKCDPVKEFSYERS
jgi:IS30 family transposase